MTLANILFWSGISYIGLAHGSGLLLNLAALSGLRRAEQGSMLAELPHVHADLEPPISLILHAHDDAARVVASLRALLALHYPALEVIVVNDGSNDDTMKVLRETFELLPFPEAYRIQLPTRSVTQIYRSMQHANLRVLDKQAGGRADAWNAGINAARYPLVCCVDCETSLQLDGLHRLALPFLANADTIAAAGVLSGAARDDRWSLRIAFIASLRARLFAPLGWSAANALLVAPSGVQLLRKDAMVDAGGYDAGSYPADTDMLMRLHGSACARQRPYRIAFVGEAIGSRHNAITQTASEQCRIGQHTLLDSMCRHRALPWRSSTRRPVRLAFLFLLLFECLGPLIEVASYAWIAAATAIGLIPPQACIAFFSFAIGTGILLSLSSLLLDALSFRNARRISEPGKLILAGLAENLGYRQMHAWWRALGLTGWLVRARCASGQTKP